VDLRDADEWPTDPAIQRTGDPTADASPPHCTGGRSAAARWRRVRG